MNKKRAMSSQKASEVKLKGHEDAREFAKLLGIGKEYKTDPQAKKDVIDSEGNSFSVKSGEKKWQIFLYGEKRFREDFTFQSMDGLSEIFLKCINSFPESRDEYLRNKKLYKEKLKNPMRELCEKLKEKRILKGFIDKSIFNSGEVDYLVIKSDNNFHIFLNEEVVNLLSEKFSVENSKAKNRYQMDDQKVIFKYEGKTYGEIEMRNDSNIHYREIKFWLDKNKTFNLLKENIKDKFRLNERIYLYGKAIKKLKKIYKEGKDDF